MGTTVLNGLTADHYVLCGPDATYSNVTGGTAAKALQGTSSGLFHEAGQFLTGGSYYNWEAFIAFDLSSIADLANAVSATLNVNLSTNNTGVTLEARLYDWGAAVDTGDYRNSAQFGSDTLLASKAGASMATGRNDLTSAAGLLTAVQAGGTLRMVLCTNNYRTSTAPSGLEEFVIRTADEAGNEPQLTVVTASPRTHQMLV